VEREAAVLQYRAALVRERGFVFIIVPLEASFEHGLRAERDDLIDALQNAAMKAGVPGRVVPVWQYRGTLNWECPPGSEWFFEKLDWMQVFKTLNVELRCEGWLNAVKGADLSEPSWAGQGTEE
jgi:hypothetical protein